MTQFATKEELDILKAQMQVLKAQLSQNEIISQDMLEVAYKHKVKENAARKSSNLFSILVGLIIIGVFAYLGYVQHVYSNACTIASILWGLLCMAVGYHRYRLNTREELLNTSLTDGVSAIMKWKKQNNMDMLVTMIGTFVWLPFYLSEVWGDLTVNIDQIVVVALIIIAAVSFSFRHYYKVNKITNELLNDIKELKG